MILDEVISLYDATEHFLSLSGQAARVIAENRRILRPHWQMFHERRDALIKKYADETGAVKQGSPNWEKFIADFQDLLTWDVDIEIKKLPPDTTMDVFDCPGATVKDLDTAMEYFVDAEEKKNTDADAEK